MGTHPIFESDFDCLTDFNMLAGRQVVTQVRCSSGRLKELGVRLRSIKNIEKITKTMKMISSAKFAKSSKLIGPARAFGVGAQSIEASADNAQKELYIAITSDRGLCGALHTTICREVEAEMAASSAAEKKLITFGDGIIKFNHFASAMKQVPTNATLHSVSSLSSADLSVFDSIDEAVLADYAEFNMTALIFALIKENFVAEQGARMVAMDGASKNAGEMIDKMTLAFNRLRQAVITTELTEIISGMVALE